MRAIIFEGLDGSGKTTLFREFEARNNHYYACFDRFPPISSYVYDRFYSRFQEDYPRRWWMDSMLLQLRRRGIVIIHVDTDPLTCFERRDNDDFTINDLTRQWELYEDVMGLVRKWNIPVMRVNGDRDPSWNVTLINQWIFQKGVKEFINGL
ncbi:hypothetical protein LCGC14_2618970 [marine sediment metagenome]|uniref:Thymidylate kinase-like domain-containing protein n=1 Tax=marine sediment metagenome TaxID=412755 RepID=A0A0F9AR79_9ZZZZ